MFLTSTYNLQSIFECKAFNWPWHGQFFLNSLFPNASYELDHVTHVLLLGSEWEAADVEPGCQRFSHPGQPS